MSKLELQIKHLTEADLSAVLELDQICFGGLWTLEGYQRELDSPNSDLLGLFSGVSVIKTEAQEKGAGREDPTNEYTPMNDEGNCSCSTNEFGDTSDTNSRGELVVFKNSFFSHTPCPLFPLAPNPQRQSPQVGKPFRQSQPTARFANMGETTAGATTGRQLLGGSFPPKRALGTPTPDTSVGKPSCSTGSATHCLPKTALPHPGDGSSVGIPSPPASSVRLLGISCFWSILDEAHITILAVHPQYHRQGFGQALLYSVLKSACKRGLERATLEVRASNSAAISLYQKFGFKIAGRRRRYYKDDEDALILWLGDLQQPQFEKTLHDWNTIINDRLTKASWS